MEKFKKNAQLIGGALAALVLAPVVALFGLVIFGLAVGAAALTTGTLAAMVWQQTRKAEAARDAMEADLAAADTQAA